MTNPLDIKVPPGARFNVLDAPVALPGHCIVCRTTLADGRKYIDFGFDIDWYGVVYFCSHCLAEVTGYLGWLIPDEHKRLIDKIDDLTLKLEASEVENVKLRAALNNLNFLGNTVSIDDGNDFVLPEIDEPEPSPGNKDAEFSKSAEVDDNKQSVRQIDESGRENILTNESGNKSSDGGDDFNLGFE